MNKTSWLFAGVVAAILGMTGTAGAQQKAWRFGHQMPADHPLN